MILGKPPPESRKPRAPAFTFGQKLDPLANIAKAGPGPASYNTEGMTAKGMINAIIVVFTMTLKTVVFRFLK